MITDEQVNIACDIYNKLSGVDAAEPSYMRKTLEVHEQSKWVKFDVDDEETHPLDYQLCNVRYHTGQVGTDKWSDLHRFWVYASCQKCVTHWQPLPEFKE